MWIAWMINILHALFLGWMIYVPIWGDDVLKLLQIVVIISLMVHWYVNNDTCAMTMIEQFVTGSPKEETFIGRIVGPVYSITSREIWILTACLLIYLLVTIDIDKIRIK